MNNEEEYLRDKRLPNYRKDSMIDVAHFDLEWLRNSDLCIMYGDEYAEARRLTDNAEKAMKVEKAKALLRAFEEVKSPVDKVKAVAEIDEQYLITIDRYNSCLFQQRLVQSAYDAILDKKGNMENYLKGQLAGLWGQPIEPRKEGESYSNRVIGSVRNQATEASQEAASRRRTRTA